MARKTKQTINILEPDLEVSKELVTPMTAQLMLDQYNTDNYRKARPNTVKRYATLMERGEWLTSASTIAISVDGKLINGQHRLMAIVKSGCTVELIIIRNAASNSKYVVDSHMPRKMRDHVQCKQEYITAINVLLRSIGLHTSNDYKNNVPFYKQHVEGDIGEIVAALHAAHGNTSDPFTSWGVRGAIILAVTNGDMTLDEGVTLFQDLLTFRKIKRKSGPHKVDVHKFSSSARSAKQSTMPKLLSILVDMLDNNTMPVYSGMGNKWHDETYSTARDKAQKLMYAVYQAISPKTRDKTQFQGPLSANVEAALGVEE